MLIIRRLNCIDAASGIVTLSKWLSGAQVERGHLDNYPMLFGKYLRILRRTVVLSYSGPSSQKVLHLENESITILRNVGKYLTQRHGVTSQKTHVQKELRQP